MTSASRVWKTGKKNDEDNGMLFMLDLMDDDEEEENKENETFPSSPIKTNQIYVDSIINQMKIFTPNKLDLLVWWMRMIDIGDFKENVEFEFEFVYTHEKHFVKIFLSSIEK